MIPGRYVSYLGVLVALPSWVLWLAIAHSHELTPSYNAILLGILCTGMGLGFVLSISTNVAAAIKTGRWLYKLGAALGCASESLIIGTLIYYFSEGLFMVDLFGEYSIWSYIGIGAAYMVCVVALPPVADAELAEKRAAIEQEVKRLEEQVEQLSLTESRERVRADELEKRLQTVYLQAASSGRDKKTITDQVIELATEVREWRTAEGWAEELGLTEQQVKGAVSAHCRAEPPRMAVRYQQGGTRRAEYAAFDAVGGLPE